MLFFLIINPSCVKISYSISSFSFFSKRIEAVLPGNDLILEKITEKAFPLTLEYLLSSCVIIFALSIFLDKFVSPIFLREK